jgi:hemolysin D
MIALELRAKNRQSKKEPSGNEPSKSPAFKNRTWISDREFLPADLEILETPPSPVRMALILIIGAFVVAALVWSWFGRIDIVAVAQGKIQPAGRVKVIEPLETAKIAAIRVENGAHVKAGDLLIEMEAGDAAAEESNARASYVAFHAEALRRAAALDAAGKRQLDAKTIAWEAETPPPIRAREEQVLAGDLSQLADVVGSMDAQIHQKQVERDRLDGTIAAQERLVATLQERVAMRTSLVQSGSGARSALIDARETKEYHETQRATSLGQRDAAAANLEVLGRERDKAFSNFIADNGQKLAEAQKQADDSREKLVKARLKSERTKLTSPIDGTVYGLSVTTIGQVVTSGEQLLRIVPQGAALEIECYLANRDAGFVKPGQQAVVKIESFPFTRYGTMAATVERVSSDAIPEPDAQQAESDPAHGRKDKAFAGAQRTQNLVFPVTLKPAGKIMSVDGQRVPLTPGMAVDVEIATGNRRILEYLFSPLVETASRAMKER